MNKKKNIVALTIIAALILGGFTIFYYKKITESGSNNYPGQNAKDTSAQVAPVSDKKNSDTPIPSDWIELRDESLGISIKVPPKILAFANMDSAGCAQSLIFGKPFNSTVYLMPENNSCDSNATSNKDLSASEDLRSKMIEVLPIADMSEIVGAIKEKMVNNRLFASFDKMQCEIDSLRISATDQKTSDTGTVPIELTTDQTCPISPFLLTVRYSPHFKKVVFFESRYGYTEIGDYYSPDARHDPKMFDRDIYSSAQVFK